MRFLTGRRQDAGSAQHVKDLVIFFASDIHGSDRCWNKFLNAAKFYGASALIMGGDLSGKAVVPIVRTLAGYEMVFLGEKARFAEAELDGNKARVAFNGFYPYVCDQAEVDLFRRDHRTLEAVFHKLITEQMKRWVERAAERLKDSEVECFVMPGNDDDFFIDPILDDGGVVKNPDLKVVQIGHCQLVSCSWVPPTPWDSPRECSEEELSAKLTSLARQLDPSRPVIANLHSPPFESGLDDAPQLGKDGAVSRSTALGRMVPVGSRAVRSFIESVQPVVALHGHIHESRGSMKIGRTVCINPGSSYGEGVLDGCIVNVRGANVRGTQLVRA